MCSVWVARRPPGYAFIDFDDRRDALDAIRELDGMLRSIFQLLYFVSFAFAQILSILPFFIYLFSMEQVKMVGG
jgi:RNA recognition motif-containing protein